MVFQPQEGAVHPEEPEFCLGIEEVPQKAFMDFLKTRHPDEYREIKKLLDKNPIVKGNRKPAVFAKWGEAREYCAAMYPGGDLPTGWQ